MMLAVTSKNHVKRPYRLAAVLRPRLSSLGVYSAGRSAAREAQPGYAARHAPAHRDRLRRETQQNEAFWTSYPEARR